MTRHEAATPGPGWTGGQWSLLRVLLSLVVAAIALGLAFDPPAPLPTDQGPAIAVPAFTGEVFFPRLLGAIAAVLAVLLGIGRFDRVSAALLWSLTLLLVLARPDLWSLAAPTLGAVLVIHALAPAAPYGSWEARGRSDPGGGWCLPPALIAVLRWLPTVTLACLGVARLGGCPRRPGRLDRPLAGTPCPRRGSSLPGCWPFGPPGTWRGGWRWRSRSVVLVAAGDAAGAAGIAILFLATFDPGWVPGREVGGAERLFYDGDCGLCHRFVRFALAEDVTGRALRYAPARRTDLRDRAARDRSLRAARQASW